MSRWLTLVTLIVAGEMIFGLPFQTARFFRPTLLEVFGFSNTQLGDLFAAYGVTAMLCYFPGGVLADRFSAGAVIAPRRRHSARKRYRRIPPDCVPPPRA